MLIYPAEIYKNLHAEWIILKTNTDLQQFSCNRNKYLMAKLVGIPTKWVNYWLCDSCILLL